MSLSIVKARGAITPLAETRVIYLLRPEVARDPENVDRWVPPAHHMRREHETERRSKAMDRWTLSREYRSSQGVVRYEAFGTGPPVVLVHGTPFSSYVWRRVVPALAETMRVYAFDLPGYGSSEKREGQDVSLAAQGRILSGLLDHLGLEKPAVVGHDFGGAIALRAHLLEGRDFRAIALIDAVALSPWGSPFYRLVQDHVGVFRQMPAYMHKALVAAYVRDATYVPMDDATLGPYIEPWLGPEGQDAFYRQIFQNDPRYTDEVQPLYARIERPVMIMWGEEDRWIPLEKGQQLHEAIPGSQLRTIPRCAHLAQEDAPDAVAGLLTGFFDS
jgi:pimeloyl-ACP methyl ester carboxylesterase